MLESEGVDHVYREYTEDPLSRSELDEIFEKLGRTPRELLRGKEAAQHGLSGDESDDDLLDLMAAHPTLLQRPILVVDDRAVLGRPVETLAELL